MNEKQILETIASLAKSQGFYGRLLRDLEGNDEAMELLVAQNFQDPVDLVLFIEG